MGNLLKSDLYRLVHGKMLWVVTGVLVAIAVLAAALMYEVSSPEFLRAAATNFEMTVTASQNGVAVDASAGEEGAQGAKAASLDAVLDEASDRAADGAADAAGAGEGAGGAAGNGSDDGAGAGADDGAPSTSEELWALAADNPGALGTADFEEVSREMRTFESVAAMLGDSAVSGGELAFVVSLVVALFFVQDFRTHFARNLVMDRRGRVRYYGEKLLLVGVLAAFFLAAAFLVAWAAFAVAGFTYAQTTPLGDMAAFLGLAWLMACAYGCLTAVVVWLTRSTGAAVAWAVAVSSGVAGAFAGQLLLLAARAVPWVGGLEPWLLSSCMQQSLGSQAADLLVRSAAAPLTMAPLAVQVLLVGAAWVAASAAVALGALRKRDV